MAYITLSNTNKIIFESNLSKIDLQGEIYKLKIYFLSTYEETALLAIQELLKDPEKYFTSIYKPYEAIDTFRFVYEGRKPSYHKYPCCPMLNSSYQNFPLPQEIIDKGPTAILEFRDWFKSVEYLLEQPDVFAMRLQSKYGIITNPKAINKENSGTTAISNLLIEEIEKTIDTLIKQAGRFYYHCEKNTVILRKFSKLTYLAYKSDAIFNNDTGYSDGEVRQLLSLYDEQFKKPLKANLIEYYRLKFNPKLKMEGFFLEKLGFKSCGHCYRHDYNPSDGNLDMENKKPIIKLSDTIKII